VRTKALRWRPETSFPLGEYSERPSSRRLNLDSATGPLAPYPVSPSTSD
jgi:hypothetical protein